MATTQELLKGVTFIDIETLPNMQGLENGLSEFFEKKFSKDINILCEQMTLEEAIQKLFIEWGGLHAEFGKIVCVSVGKMQSSGFRIRTIADEDEKFLLVKLASVFETIGPTILCGHNAKDFDFPFMMRRYIVNRVPVPPILNVAGKKPWEIPHEDTMEMWSGTRWKHRVSLNLLSHLFGLPSPKEKMSGGEVQTVMFDPIKSVDEKLQKVAEYCAGDVLTTANCYCAMKGVEFIDPSTVDFVY